MSDAKTKLVIRYRFLICLRRGATIHVYDHIFNSNTLEIVLSLTQITR